MTKIEIDDAFGGIIEMPIWEYAIIMALPPLMIIVIGIIIGKIP